MLHEEKLLKLKEINKERGYYFAIQGLFDWDQWIGLPSEGHNYREELVGFITEKNINLFTSDEAKDLAKYFSKLDLTQVNDDIERALIRTFLNEYNQNSKIPKEKAIEFAKLIPKSQIAWVEAMNKSDYQILKPYLEKIFELKIEMAKYLNKDKNAFETIIEMNDEGISLDEVNREFSKLKNYIVELVKKINDSDVQIEDSFLYEDFDKDELYEFVKYLVESIGYDKQKGGYGKVPHPFTVMLGPKDVRITTNCDTFKFGVFATIHEAGHAMYGYRGNEKVDEAQLWSGIKGGFHEGQSRFYENIIGKSKEFWKYFYPELQKRFPQFKHVSLDEYYKAINKVQSSLKRILADEVTYSLHPIIRFELEQELINGKLNFYELPEAWNDKYEKYLGIRPQNHAQGILQDIHWAMGAVGYFQSYALGNIYGGQIRKELLKDIPNLYDEIAKGNFELLNSWLEEKIHQYGSCYTANDIIRKITGQGLNADDFIEYINEKYGDIYSLTIH